MTQLRSICSLFLALCALPVLAADPAPAAPVTPPTDDKPVFETRTRRKPMARPHSDLVRVHTLDDLLKRPEAESKGLPSNLPSARSEGIGEYLPPDPNIPIPRRVDQDRQNSMSGVTKDDIKDARRKDLLTAGEMTRDPRKSGGTDPELERPDIDDLSEHMLYKDVTTLEDQGDVRTAPERGLDARERLLKEEGKNANGGAKAPSLSQKDAPPGQSGGRDLEAEVSGAAPGARPEEALSSEAAAIYSDAMRSSPSGRSMLREQEEKDRTASTFSRSRELMAAIAAPHLEAERARGGAGNQNALQLLSSSYLDAARRSQPGNAPALAAVPAGQPPAHSTLLSSTPVGVSAGGPSGLGMSISPLGSSPLGSFTPASTEVRMGGFSSPSGFSSASASPSYNLPSAAMAPDPRPMTPALGGSDLLRQRRLDQGRVRSQMDRLPGQISPGRFPR